ncbi:ATP-binding protein [Priestia aryabhattai]|uniref:ATP-binding protein n=1 Tax=Priestia aryabhattai TaxID=412384 RepID=UPI0039A1290A
MQQIQLPNVALTFHSEECLKHTYRKNGQDVVKPIQKIVVNGEVVCPRCQVEEQTKELQQFESDRADRIEKLRRYNVLYKESLLSDETILTATFANYTATEREEIENKELMLQYRDRLRKGEQLNIILQGVTGAGKSHLCYALLKDLNEYDKNVEDPREKKTCLFINMEEMARLIRDSFRNKDSKYTENYLIELMIGVDYLVLDDLGSETGAIDTDKRATDFIQRVLYAVTNGRQGKTTLATFNLAGKTLYTLYDKKGLSRLMTGKNFVVFKETTDKRTGDLPF